MSRPSQGTIFSPKYIEGLTDSSGEQHRRYFVYATDSGLTSGTTTGVRFSISRPITQVWSYFKDFNRWQNPANHFYSGIVGDLEGGTFRLTVDRISAEYRVLKVIAPYLIVLSQIVENSGPLAGEGGFMVFMLNETNSETLVTIFMEHSKSTTGVSEEDAIGYWRESAPGNLKKWRESFIPTLKRIVCAT